MIAQLFLIFSWWSLMPLASVSGFVVSITPSEIISALLFIVNENIMTGVQQERDGTNIYFDTLGRSFDSMIVTVAPLTSSEEREERTIDISQMKGGVEVEIYIYDGGELLWWTSFDGSDQSLKHITFSPGDVPFLQDSSRFDFDGKEELFSSIHCLYGSQRFPWLNETVLGMVGNSTKLVHPSPVTESEIQKHRVCEYRNVCIEEKRLTFYNSERGTYPEFMKMSENISFHHLHSQTYFYDTLLNQSYKIPVKNKFGSIPSDAQFAINSKVYFYQEQSQSYNFAHCLLEDIMPILMTMDVFNLGNYEDAVIIHNCYGGSYESSFVEEKVKLCIQNIEMFSELLGLTVVHFSNVGDTCFETIAMGHNMAFSQWHVDKHVSIYFRWMRDKIVSKFGFTSLIKPVAHQILVLMKGSIHSIPSATISDWPNLCDDVKSAVSTAQVNVPVECITPTTKQLKKIVYKMHTSTVVLSEHGSLAVNSLFFARDSIVHIILCARTGCKPNPTLTAVHVKYVFINSLDDLLGAILYALGTSSQTFHIRNVDSGVMYE